MNFKVVGVTGVLAVSVMLSGADAGERVKTGLKPGNNRAGEIGGKRDSAKQKQESARASREEAKADRESKREEAIADRDAKKAEAEEAREAMKEESQEKAQERRENVVEKRENNQAKRIQHGINKGYLTEDEVKKLEAQQASISTLEDSFKSDGKLSGSEFKQLQEEMNTASHCIWGEKHDTDGNQMAAYRFGKNVFAKDSLTAKLSDENLSGAEAKAITKDFRKMMDLKKSLSGDLSDAERAKLQAQYDDLLNQYFETR